jgi:hypothetical protein
MLSNIMTFTKSTLPWPLLIMSYSRIFYRFSEYKTYATFMIRNYPNRFEYHKLADFGECGIRYREAGPVLRDIIITTCSNNNDDNFDTNYVDNNINKVKKVYDNNNTERKCYKNDNNIFKSAIESGLSYVRVRDYTLKKWNQTNQVPGYIQLDHVYSFDVDHDDDDSIVVDIAIPSSTTTTTSTTVAFAAVTIVSEYDSVNDELEQKTQQILSQSSSSSSSSSEQKIYQTIQILAISYIWDKIVIITKINIDDVKIMMIDILRRYSQNFIVLFVLIILVSNIM